VISSLRGRCPKPLDECAVFYYTSNCSQKFTKAFITRSTAVEHIMRLGGWESLDMVLRYTRSVKFEDSLRLYRKMEALSSPNPLA
jgi:hypothetical protein